MALNSDTLGQELYNVRNQFSNKTIDELVMVHGSIEAARLAHAKAEAAVIIDHIKDNAEGKYQTGALTAGPTTVTAVNPAATHIKIN